jgi:signal recognition particle receptor subunit beta
MHIHHASHHASVNILYYGPIASGKTENVFQIYSHLNPSFQGDRKTFDERRVPVIVQSAHHLSGKGFQDLQVEWALHTVPGMIWFAFTRKAICANIDGAVFVADSQWSRLETNVECLHELSLSLHENGWDIAEFPWVIQYNKRDLSSAAPIPYMQSKLQTAHISYIEACAHTGKGVMETFHMITRLVAQTYRFTHAQATSLSHAVLPKRWPEKGAEPCSLKPERDVAGIRS